MFDEVQYSHPAKWQQLAHIPESKQRLNFIEAVDDYPKGFTLRESDAEYMDELKKIYISIFARDDKDAEKRVRDFVFWAWSNNFDANGDLRKERGCSDEDLARIKALNRDVSDYMTRGRWFLSSGATNKRKAGDVMLQKGSAKRARRALIQRLSSDTTPPTDGIDTMTTGTIFLEWQHVFALEEELKKLRAEKAEFEHQQSDYKHLKTEDIRLREQVKELESCISIRDGQIRRLREESKANNDARKADVARAEAERKAVEEARKQDTMQILALTADRETSNTELDNVKDLFEKETVKNNKLSNELHESKKTNTKLTDELGRLRQEYGELEGKLRESELLHDKTIDQLDDAKGAKAEAETTSAGYEQKYKEMAEQVEKEKKTNEKMSADLDRVTAIQEEMRLENEQIKGTEEHYKARIVEIMQAAKTSQKEAPERGNEAEATMAGVTGRHSSETDEEAIRQLNCDKRELQKLLENLTQEKERLLREKESHAEDVDRMKHEQERELTLCESRCNCLASRNDELVRRYHELLHQSASLQELGRREKGMALTIQSLQPAFEAAYFGMESFLKQSFSEAEAKRLSVELYKSIFSVWWVEIMNGGQPQVWQSVRISLSRGERPVLDLDLYDEE